jgi:hypothetical protein
MELPLHMLPLVVVPYTGHFHVLEVLHRLDQLLKPKPCTPGGGRGRLGVRKGG